MYNLALLFFVLVGSCLLFVTVYNYYLNNPSWKTRLEINIILTLFTLTEMVNSLLWTKA